MSLPLRALRASRLALVALRKEAARRVSLSKVGKIVGRIIPIGIVEDQVFEDLRAEGKHQIGGMIFGHERRHRADDPGQPLVRDRIPPRACIRDKSGLCRCARPRKWPRWPCAVRPVNPGTLDRSKCAEGGSCTTPSLRPSCASHCSRMACCNFSRALLVKRRFVEMVGVRVKHFRYRHRVRGEARSSQTPARRPRCRRNPADSAAPPSWPGLRRASSR